MYSRRRCEITVFLFTPMMNDFLCLDFQSFLQNIMFYESISPATVIKNYFFTLSGGGFHCLSRSSSPSLNRSPTWRYP